MPLASSNGPRWVRAAIDRRSIRQKLADFVLRLFFGRRTPRSTTGGDADDPGASGAGCTAPRIPPTPVLSGAAAKRPGEP